MDPTASVCGMDRLFCTASVIRFLRRDSVGKEFVVCSRCGEKLFGSAVCVPCENARALEEDRNFKNMVSGIVRIIKATRTHMKATIKESGFSIKELKLDPEVLLFIQKPLLKKKRRRHRKKRK